MAGITISGPDPADLTRAVEAEIDAFDQVFMSPLNQGGLGNSPLSRGEKALLRTYLLARLTDRASRRQLQETSEGTADISDLFPG